MNTASKVDNLVKDWKEQGILAADMCVKLAEACMGWAYVFGARGDYCEPVNRRNRDWHNHPTIKTKCKNFEGTGSCSGCKWYPGGRTRTFDCRGFTYWVVLKVTGVKIMGAGATSQYNDNSNWSEKGLIANMPNVVCCVFKHNSKTGKMEHTGLHVGNGKIIHCSNGVQTGKTTDKGWTHYAIPKSLKDGGTVAPTTDSGTTTTEPVIHSGETTGTTANGSLQKGSRGDRVIDLQKMLMQLGYDLPVYGADGDFGNETLEAVKRFQRDNGLVVDGKVGVNTLAVLEKLVSGKPVQQPFTYTVTISGLDEETAKALVEKYPNAVSHQSVG